ncbi:flagellar hook-associated protein FlgK [Tersicoccus phoenicis]|uniref:Flagellar hook-associated protein 1 n=1 Tax=Tersicoccus phoenicis TaxID=554083 RepID=A0A1R1L7M7_9MICC|nr:flagellar hook-associated protein FlgK [Tersicoccus phoenicis]OMH23533.1 flagellar hook-associated protein FlgK [Tersicoccus phoenicis]
MSSFAGLQLAQRGLGAAQQTLLIAAQNVDNVATPGYTRQRVEQSALAPAAVTRGSLASPVGAGLTVTGISRLGDALLDAGVRTSAAAAGYAEVRATTYGSLEDAYGEPGTTALSGRLSAFWSAWSDLANNPDEPGAGVAVLQAGRDLGASLATARTAVTTQWRDRRADVDALTSQVNAAAGRLAELNRVIGSTTAAGGTANELIDERARLAETLASTAGATAQLQPDGGMTVRLNGTWLVSGTAARVLTVTGPADPASGAPVRVSWQDTPGTPVALTGGELAATLSVLAPADDAGTGGPIAEAAAALDGIAGDLATAVNTAHNAGTTRSGSPAGDFFALDPRRPAAAGLTVVPTDPAALATAARGSGPLDGTAAAGLARVGSGPDSPDRRWATAVAALGAAARSATGQQTITAAAAGAARSSQTSSGSVSLDEENVTLVSAQYAYQAAARVLTTMDETLDILINRTGTVGLR